MISKNNFIKNKKAGGGISDTWVEFSCLGFVILAVLLSLVSRNTTVTYLMVFGSGMIIGRILYIRKFNTQLVMHLFAISILLGFIIGSFVRGLGSTRFIVVLYIIGAYLGYVLHKEHYLW